MCGSSSDLEGLFYLQKNKKGGHIMTTCRELFSELEEWEAYKPMNMPSSIGKSMHIQETKRQIIDKLLSNVDFKNQKEDIIHLADKHK